MRRRRLRVAPGVLVACALLVAACSSDDPTSTATDTPSSTTTVVLGQPVPLDEVELGAHSASSALRVADTTYVIDGLHRVDADRAQLRIWLLDGATPDEAVPVDLPVAGGLWFVDAVWFDDHLAISGTQCDDWYEWNDVRDPSAHEDPPCLAGSVERLLLVDLVTWRVEEVEGLSRSWEEGGLDLLVAPDGALLVHDGTSEPSLLRMAAHSSTPERIADVPGSAACFVGDDLVVVRPVGGEDTAEPLLPLHELFEAEVLRDRTWVSLELPVTDLDGTRGDNRGCTADGLVVTRGVIGMFADEEAPHIIELRQVDGALDWVPLPVADLAGRRVTDVWARGGGLFGRVFADTVTDTSVVLLGGGWVALPDGFDLPSDPLLVIDEEAGSILVKRPDGEGYAAYDPLHLELLVLRE